MEHNGATEDSPVVLSEQRHLAKERLEGGGNHVTDAINQEVNHPIRDVGVTTSFKPVSELLHEEGRVKELVGKIEDKVPDLGRFGEEKLAAKLNFVEGVQWETITC